MEHSFERESEREREREREREGEDFTFLQAVVQLDSQWLQCGELRAPVCSDAAACNKSPQAQDSNYRRNSPPLPSLLPAFFPDQKIK
jgi:hypothetical protein